MATDETAKLALETVGELLDELNEIVESAKRDQDYVTAEARLDRWKLRAQMDLRKAIGASEASRFSQDNVVNVRYADPALNVTRPAETYRAYLTSLKEELISHPESVFAPASTADSIEVPIVAQTQTNRPDVFIAHGGDTPLRDKLELFLWRAGYRPFIVDTMPSLGMNPDAKVDHYLDQCTFAVILAEAHNASSQDEKKTPRLNVIDEITRVRKTLDSRFVLLLEEGLVLPSNQSGSLTWEPFHRDSFDKALAAIYRELRGHNIYGVDE